eukprot:12927117-Alexandrium_andersonii.AAC.1
MLRYLASGSLMIALRVGCSVTAIELHLWGRCPCDCALRLGGRCDCDWVAPSRARAPIGRAPKMALRARSVAAITL